MVGHARPRHVVSLLLAVVALTPGQAGAQQSLDDAVFDQLRVKCTQLLAGRNIDRLVGNLKGICQRPGSAPPVSGASGGGAAVPASAPAIIQQQRREQILAAAGGDASMAASGDAARLDLGGRFAFFIVGRGVVVDKNANEFEDGYNADTLGGTLGGSYRISPDLVAGLAFDYFHEDGNYDQGGDFETDSYGVIGFAALTPGPLVLEASAGWAYRDYERTRHAVVLGGIGGQEVVTSGPVQGDYSGNAWFAEAAASVLWRWGPITWTPRAALGWSRVDYDSYAERGDTGVELRFEDDDEHSLRSALGLGAATVLSFDRVSFVPEVAVSWVHEFEDDQRTAEVSFVEDMDHRTFNYSTEQPDRNYGLLQAGLTAVLPNGLQPFVQFETLFENSLYDSYLVAIGVSFDL
jgi:outer membrane autotransporter protein